METLLSAAYCEGRGCFLTSPAPFAVAVKKSRCTRKETVFLTCSAIQKNIRYIFYALFCLQSLDFTIQKHKTLVIGHLAFVQP